MKRHINMLREFSVPLLLGVALALAWANLCPESYHRFLHGRFLGQLDFHFVTNDIFMVFFFGIASAEITQACLPGGDLNPPGKALAPLIATAGGVVGPVAAYLAGASLLGSADHLPGWGIPTATDIALGWLAARLVFGARHPAVSFLLLLAIADDAVGMAIIALFYPDASRPPAPLWLLLVAAGMGIAWVLRRRGVKGYWPYFILAGGASWAGLFLARLHPALALVFVVPFLPHGRRETLHLFEENPGDRSTLHRFEHEWKVMVDFGLFLFGLANAGVEINAVGTTTWLVLGALLLGKTGGITAAGLIAGKLGFPLPKGMGRGDLFLVSFVAATGFTVSLFIAGQAFSDPVLMSQGKMGALLSVIVVPLSLVAGAFRRSR